jgi:hypothetical protein
MKKAILGMIALLFFSLPAYTGAQDRSRMSIFVPVPVGGTGQQQVYFQNNFKKELVGANYPVAETRASSQYSMVLDISDNLYFDPLEPVDEQNQMYILAVTLERSADAQEIVNFSFPFNDPESMAEWNLFLLYQALADAVPISEAAQVGAAKQINVPPPPPHVGGGSPNICDLYRGVNRFLAYPDCLSDRPKQLCVQRFSARRVFCGGAAEFSAWYAGRPACRILPAGFNI